MFNITDFCIINKRLYEKQMCLQDFENDEKLLKRVLTVALKQKKKFLTCEKCEAAKRSVIGFISHMQFCGKNEQVSVTSNNYYVVYVAF